MKLRIIGAISILVLILIYSCQSDQSIEFRRYYTAGAVVYQNRCQNCHGTKGEGLGTLIPPLSDSVYLKANKALLACWINYGLKAKIHLAGKEFDDEMPANNLTPIEIAQALTYVTNSFGSNMGVTTDEQVQADLDKCN